MTDDGADGLAKLLREHHRQYADHPIERVADGFAAAHSAAIADFVLKGHRIEELASKAGLSPPTDWARHIEEGLLDRDKLNVLRHRFKALGESIGEINELLAKLATRDDVKGSEDRLTGKLTGGIRSVTGEIHAAEDHLIGQLQMVNGKISGEKSDPQKPVVKRKRD